MRRRLRRRQGGAQPLRRGAGDAASVYLGYGTGVADEQTLVLDHGAVTNLVREASGRGQ